MWSDCCDYVSTSTTTIASESKKAGCQVFGAATDEEAPTELGLGCPNNVGSFSEFPINSSNAPQRNIMEQDEHYSTSTGDGTEDTETG